MKERKAPPEPKGTTSETWNSVPWKKLAQHCFRIQKRIYRASQRGNQRAVHKLQKLLMKSGVSLTFGEDCLLPIHSNYF